MLTLGEVGALLSVVRGGRGAQHAGVEGVIAGLAFKTRLGARPITDNEVASIFRK